jgi:ATP-dependent Clp protease ATP-binding subunit ClpB
MTSNLGSEAISGRGAVLGFGPEGAESDEQARRERVLRPLREHFRPEFLNRIDEIILFKRLSRGDMDAIVRIQLERVEKLLADRRMAIALDPAATHWLAERGYDPVYGARPLKRVIQKELVDPIARKLLAGELEDGAVIGVGAGADGLPTQPLDATANTCIAATARRNRVIESSFTSTFRVRREDYRPALRPP